MKLSITASTFTSWLGVTEKNSFIGNITPTPKGRQTLPFFVLLLSKWGDYPLLGRNYRIFLLHTLAGSLNVCSLFQIGLIF